tara:strand:+ start:6293 stop:6823 length:531 start_codon:yes stop_codon:yes gene_type:complete
MIAVLLITALFVFISVYFFFRAEKLQRIIAVLNRDTAKAQKENQFLSKSMALMAGNTEGFAKNRFQLLLDKAQCQKTSNELALIKPFIDNYSLIFKACLMKKGILHTTTKQCFSNLEGDIYTNFFITIIKKDAKIQRLWSSNNFIGFISLVEALLVKYEEQSQSNLTVENTIAVSS